MNPKIRFGLSSATTVGVNQCSACRHVFSSLSAFESHRRDLACCDPLTVKLRISGLRAFQTDAGRQKLEVWSQPGPVERTF